MNKCNIKFSNLYNIIKNGDNESLDFFLSSNPDFDYTKTLNVGRKVTIFEEAINRGAYDLFKIIIDNVCKYSPTKYTGRIIFRTLIILNKAPYYFKYYYNKLQNIDDNIYIKILYDILYLNTIKDMTILDEIIRNDTIKQQFNFNDYLKNNKEEFESKLYGCKNDIIKYFVNYYKQNNISIISLYSLILLHSNIPQCIVSDLNNMDWNIHINTIPLGILYFFKYKKCNYNKLNCIINFEDEMIKFITAQQENISNYNFHPVIMTNITNKYNNISSLDYNDLLIIKSIKNLLSNKFYNFIINHRNHNDMEILGELANILSINN